MGLGVGSGNPSLSSCVCGGRDGGEASSKPPADPADRRRAERPHRNGAALIAERNAQCDPSKRAFRRGVYRK